MWRATFAWHVEDMDLFSINYIHFGAPKFWYAILQGKSVQLENTMRSASLSFTETTSTWAVTNTSFPSKVNSFATSPNVGSSSDRSFLASRTLLAQSYCKPNFLVQHAGEFVIAYPHGYHAGFNLGFNCAESVNFALESWLDIGGRGIAQACGCVGDRCVLSEFVLNKLTDVYAA